MANPYIDLPASEAGARLLQAHTNWLRELQQSQAAAWRHALLAYLSMLSPRWAPPSAPQPPTVAKRMAALSMTVIAGGRD